MKPFALFVVLGIAAAVVVSIVGRVDECRNPNVVVLEGTIVSKVEGIRQRETVEPKPGCSSCPGATTVVVEQPVYRVTVDAVEAGRSLRLSVEVPAGTYQALAIGQPVQVRLFRGSISGRECRPPELLLSP